MKRISELLREEREKRGYLLEDVEHAIKIRKEFLVAIEQGSFHKLPSETYALGYVKNYASFLGIPMQKVTPLFRREYETDSPHEVVPHFRKTQHMLGKKFFLSAKALLIGMVIFIVGGYILFQYHSLLFGPQLAVFAPKDGVSISGNVIQVKGRTTDPYATVEIDGEEVYVGMDGSFQKALYAFPGEKKISIVAKNRFGKQTEKVVRVKVE